MIEAIHSIPAQVDFPWQFFPTAHVASFALLFIYDEAGANLSIIARACALAVRASSHG